MSVSAENTRFIISPEVFEHVLNVARRLASSSDLTVVLGQIINALRDTLRADRASVFQYDPVSHQLFATQAHGLPASLRLPADRGIVGECVKTKKLINIPDAYADARFNRDVDRQTGYRTRCILTIPLLDPDGQLVGVAQVLNKSIDDSGVFTEEDESIALHLADQAAVALKRAALLEAERKKEKYEADLDVARMIQVAGLPDALPTFEGYDVAGSTFPADETGGDAYDLVDLRRFRAPGHEHEGADGLVLMADAAGHGIGPALSVMQVLSMVRMACRLDAPLEYIAYHVNSQLQADLPMGRFVTAFLGRLDIKKHELWYVAAGQAPVIQVRANPTEHVRDQVLNANAMPLGIDPEFFYDPIFPLQFHPGDVCVLLSDGYFEATNPQGEQFGFRRAIECVRDNIGRPAAEIINQLRSTLLRFTQGNPAIDDQTAVLIRRKPE